MSPGREGLRRCRRLARSVAPAQRVRRPCVAHPECHQGAAVIEIYSGPVPAACFGIELLARPFVVEPRRPVTALVRPSIASSPAPRVAAGCSSTTPTAGPAPCGCNPALALQERRLRGARAQVAWRNRLRRPPSASARRPSARSDQSSISHVAFRLRARRRDRSPARALALAHDAAGRPRVGDGRMREQDLARRKPARVALADARCARGRTSPESRAVRPCASASQPVTYHHSMRWSGWLPASRGNSIA